MQTSLTVILTWLSINFGLPATVELPQVELVAPAKMHAVRFRGPESDQAQRAAVGVNPMARQVWEHDTEALYDDESRTIYLREGWKGATPAEVSVLVHEMVHHLQNVAGLKYECPQQREHLAYVAQDRWLARSGRSLMKEFKLNPMTLLVRTKCMY